MPRHAILIGRKKIFMKFEIRQEMGHYVMYVDGKFYGSYDTVSEAADDIDAIRAETEAA